MPFSVELCYVLRGENGSASIGSGDEVEVFVALSIVHPVTVLLGRIRVSISPSYSAPLRLSIIVFLIASLQLST
jgi:hypothetical protein